MFKSPRFAKPNTKILLVGGGVLLMFFVGTTSFFFWKYMSTKNDVVEPGSTAAQETSSRIIEQVSKLYKVPTDEAPTVAAVQDKKKLAGQAFFKDAKDGDYVLVYSKSKVAMLYRETENRLINVGPITLGNEQPEQTAGASTEK